MESKRKNNLPIAFLALGYSVLLVISSIKDMIPAIAASRKIADIIFFVKLGLSVFLLWFCWWFWRSEQSND